MLAESAIVLFLEHNVCFREPIGDQVLLIFPELINERPPLLTDATRLIDDVTYVVTGSIENVYASLVVLLGYTNVLRRKDQWRVDQGTGTTYCPRGGHAIRLLIEPERVVLSEHERQFMAAETAAATERTTFAVVATQLRGYLTEVAGRQRSLVVFVSYPWGDLATESWVRDRLAPDLEQAGLEVVLDRATTRVGDSLARSVERVQTADRVLVIATPEYAQKYDNAAGTVVAAEADVINLRLLGTEEQKSTVLPVLLAGSPAESLPTLMRTRIHADFRNPDRYFIELFELVLALHDLAPDISALKDLRAALLRDQRGITERDR